MSGKLPYMFIVVSKTPSNDSTPNNTKNENNKWVITETAYFRDNITDNLLYSSDLIIDLLNGKIVKKRDDLREDSELLEHYMAKYSDKIVEAVREFFTKNPKTWENFIQQANKVAEQLDKKEE